MLSQYMKHILQCLFNSSVRTAVAGGGRRLEIGSYDCDVCVLWLSFKLIQEFPKQLVIVSQLCDFERLS